MDLAVKNGVIIRAGETLNLPATVTGRPKPSITWTKDDGKPDKERVEILEDGNESIVHIKNAQRKDSGKYLISVCNPSGIKSGWARVDVMGSVETSIHLYILLLYTHHIIRIIPLGYCY